MVHRPDGNGAHDPDSGGNSGFARKDEIQQKRFCVEGNGAVDHRHICGRFAGNQHRIGCCGMRAPGSGRIHPSELV